PYRGQLWCHMMSDAPTAEAQRAELFAFAEKLELKPEWIQENEKGKPELRGYHFDLPAATRARAILLGAEAVTAFEMLRRNPLYDHLR
ncbi:MAG: DUF4031 domain-containing protein, partial [Candidatus Binatia bacterium]